MPEVWLIIIGCIAFLIIYGMASSKLKARKRRIAREKILGSLKFEVQHCFVIL